MAPLIVVTCKARFTLAGKLVDAVSTPGAVTTRIACTLVEVVLTVLTCIIPVAAT